MGAPKESSDQKQLDQQQSQLLSEQQKQLDTLNAQKQQDQLDFISRLQGQASTPSGVASGSLQPQTNSASSFGNFSGLSGLFSGGSTIG